MIPFNRPELSVRDILSSIATSFKDSSPKIEETFKKYLNRKYVLFTNSCRSALYLSYNSMNSMRERGEIIVSPLTCSVAILPIICAKYKPHFVDINPYTFNIDAEKVNEAITSKTQGIQVIHLGGNPCDMRAINEIADDHGIVIIEDCAQALGSEYQNTKIGSFGKSSCFTFSKNLYGIGGGILATDDKEIFEQSRLAQHYFESNSIFIPTYRLLRNFAGMYRGNKFGDHLYDKIVSLRSYHPNANTLVNSKNGCEFLLSTLSRPKSLVANVAYYQFKNLEKLLEKRRRNAHLLSKGIEKIGGIEIQKETEKSKSAFGKFMIKTDLDSKTFIEKLNEKGIEANHLEQKYKTFYQERFDRNPLFYGYKSVKECKNYLKIHDHIVTLPLSSNMGIQEIFKIVNTVGSMISE